MNGAPASNRKARSPSLILLGAAIALALGFVAATLESPAASRIDRSAENALDGIAAHEPEVHAIVTRLNDLGMRSVVACRAASRPDVRAASSDTTTDSSRSRAMLQCAGSDPLTSAAAAKTVAGIGAQAVVVTSSAAEAAAFIGELRALRNFAMVVAGPGIDPVALDRLLTPDSKSWLAVATTLSRSGARGDEADSKDRVVLTPLDRGGRRLDTTVAVSRAAVTSYGTGHASSLVPVHP